MNHPRDPWSRFREALPPTPPEDLSPPPGFATRVVARARSEARADHAGLQIWRRWSLLGAAAALVACASLFLATPPSEPPAQFVPVPDSSSLQVPLP